MKVLFFSVSVFLVFALELGAWVSAHANEFACGYADARVATKRLNEIKRLSRDELTGQYCKQSTLEGENYSSTPLAYGARKLLATLYGCAALNQPLIGRGDSDDALKGLVQRNRISEYHQPRSFKSSHAQVVSRHSYLKAQAKNCALADQCKDLKEVTEPTSCDETQCFFYWNPPLYQRLNGATLFFKYPRGNPPSSGVDCSAAVEQSMKAAGLLLVPKTPLTRFTTATIWDYVQMEKSCFAPVDVLDDLKPGDILNAAGRHVVMIDTVAKDPFNIRRDFKQIFSDLESEVLKATPPKTNAEKDAYARSRCQIMSEPSRLSDFRFTVFQSSPEPGSSDLGFQNNRGFPGIDKSTLGNAIKEKALTHCVAEFWRHLNGGELKRSFQKSVVSYRTEVTPRGKKRIQQIQYVPCQRSERGCAERYESAFLNEQQKLLQGRTLQARHKLTPECLSSSLKNPEKSTFDPYDQCASNCNLEATFEEREKAI